MMECYILAGGQSRRFGEDKLLYRINSLRTIEYVVKSAQKVCETVYVVAKDREKFGDLGVFVVEDLLPDQAPIVGLYTALKLSQRDRVLVLGGDMPLMKPELLGLMMEEFEEPVTIASAGGKLHPLVGVYSRALYPVVEEYLKIGRRSLIDLIRSLEFRTVGEEKLRRVDPDLSSLMNMNTKEDLQRIRERMERSGVR